MKDKDIRLVVLATLGTFLVAFIVLGSLYLALMSGRVASVSSARVRTYGASGSPVPARVATQHAILEQEMEQLMKKLATHEAGGQGLPVPTGVQSNPSPSFGR